MLDRDYNNYRKGFHVLITLVTYFKFIDFPNGTTTSHKTQISQFVIFI